LRHYLAGDGGISFIFSSANHHSLPFSTLPSSPVAFWLDDGTGLMQCTFWPPDLDVFARDDFLYGGGGEGGREGGKAVARVMEKVGAGAGFRRTRDSGLDDRAFQAIQVGHSVVVLGDLQHYRG